MAPSKEKYFILVVDDEPTHLELISEFLSPDGYEVVTADNSREALDKFVSQPISVVITDLRMPRQDGLSLMKQMKKKKPNIEVIVITAYGEVDSYLQALDEGAFEYLHKPIDPKLLRQTIKKALKNNA